MKELMADTVWVSWESHRRSKSIVARLGVEYVEFSSARNRLVKHPVFMYKTWRLIAGRRPKLLFIQSPSMLLNLLAVFLKPFYGFRLIVDAHNAGVYSCEKSSDYVKWIYPWVQRRADVTLVTNQVLADIVDRNGGRAQQLIDPLPVFEQQPSREFDLNQITFICTFAVDEPFLEVFAAARLIPRDITINVTGNVDANRHLIPGDIPENVNFTGFLPDAEFVALLAGSAAVIDLTTWQDCLVCGAYESMALETPLILSDTPVNRGIFSSGALFCDNTAEGIAAAVKTVLAENGRLRQEAVGGKARLKELFERQLAALDLDVR